MGYLTLKALHVACVLVFVGGLMASAVTLAFLETPRGAGRMIVLRRQRAWDRYVTSPAMIALWALGVYMAATTGQFRAPWLSFKLVPVIALSALHGALAGHLRKAADDPVRAVPRWVGRTPAFVAASLAIVAYLAVAKP